MTELFFIIIQFIVFLVLFTFPLNPKTFNNLINLKSGTLNYIDCHIANIIIFFYLLLICSFFNFNLKYIFLSLLLISIFFLILRYKEYLNLFNNKYFVTFLFFVLITNSVFIAISYSPRLEWDGFHWIEKALVFFNGARIQDLKNVGMPEYPHLGGYVWAFFWKNSILELEYFGRFFFAYIYIISIFTLLNFSKIKSQLINFFLIFTLIFITYDLYLLGGYQEYLIFSTLLIAARFINLIDFNKSIEHKKMILVLLIFSILMWFKDEGLFYFLIFGSLLIFMQREKVLNKIFYLLTILLLIYIQHYLQKNIIGIYAFNVEFLSDTFVNQLLNIEIIIHKAFSITKHLIIAFIKYPLLILILIAYIYLIITGETKKNLVKYFFYAFILNYLFVYSVYLHDPNPYEWILSVTLDRVIFQTSGFYILIVLLAVKKIDNIKLN